MEENKISKDQVVQKNLNIQIRSEANNKYLLFNTENHDTLIINETGKHILESCDGKSTIQEVINKIQEEYEIDNTDEIDLEKTVMEFLQLLAIKSLLKIY